MLEPLPGDPRGYQGMGYLRFVELMETEPGSRERSTSADPHPGYLAWLIRVQNELVALLEFLDPQGIRFPAAPIATGSRPARRHRHQLRTPKTDLPDPRGWAA